MPLRPDLQQLLDEVDALDRAADALVSQVSDAQFFWQPNEGRSWSIAQCLQHLAVTNAFYGHAIAKAIEAARAQAITGDAPIESTFFGRLFLKTMEPPVTKRVRAPGRIIPRTHKTRDEIMRAFLEEHRLMRERIHAAAAIDVNRAKFTNPFFRMLRVRVGTGLRIGPAHERRHLWQAENVRKAPGFPDR
jgi:DinB superfamily